MLSSPTPYIKALYQEFEHYLQQKLIQWPEKNPMTAPCRYSVEGGGKRYRPLLILMVADALGGKKTLLDAACGIEFFHCSSLIADDLPSMDDASTRRGKPSVHIAFGESTALLASYTLITEGYAAVEKSASTLAKEDRYERLQLVLKGITRAMGREGIQQGQFYDLHPADNYNQIEYINHLHQTKTAVLFELSFLIGWLFAGGAIELLNKVEAFGSHFGHIFQIVDDLDDMEEDRLKEFSINLPLMTSVDYALDQIKSHYAACEILAKELDLYQTPVFELLQNLFLSVAQT